MEKYKVVVVDDHTLLAQAIAQMVESFDAFTCLYTCSNGSDLLNKLDVENQNLPHIILMDVNMPILNGIETTQKLSELYPQIQVLALSVEDDDLSMINMLKAGAVGYLLKDTEKQILERALLDIVENGFYHSSKTTKLLLNNLTPSDSQILLSERETQLLKLACEELTYKEIADKMCLSPKTVDGYRESLFVKLNVKNRVGLVVYAIKNKIYTP